MAHTAQIFSATRRNGEIAIHYALRASADELPGAWDGTALSIRESDLPALLEQLNALLSQEHILVLLPLLAQYRQDGGRITPAGLSRLANARSTIDGASPSIVMGGARA